MEKVVVSASVGVMGPLLVKLTELMGDEYKKLTEVRKHVPFFKDELSAMSDFLEKLADYDQLDPQIKGWRDRVREMAYDIEDSIDNFMCHNSRANDGFLEKMRHILRRLKEHRQIASQFKELRSRVVQERERYNRYKIDDLQPSFSTVAVDPRVTALYKVSASLVGIDGPREELVKLLLDMEPQLKVISIMGFGGLGKTTLAKEVYQKTGEHFECKVFVSISQRPDFIRLLKNIESKLGTHCSSLEVQDILNGLMGHLRHKRYFIVVDDLWDVPAWEIISCAFPDNGLGSRVVVTTRVEDVASRASSSHECIYKINPLNDQDSRQLFLHKIFGSEDGCPSHYQEVSTQILKKCGGLPLAIITMASLLARRPERLVNEWEGILNALGDPLAINPTMEGMRQILDLSYKNLPHHLRTCLLYLGKYPEDHEIQRDDVVRQWMAEGFVGTCQRIDEEEDVARSYFNELVNRSLIQPERIDCGEVLSCRVHDMMLDLILKRCVENNFTSVAHSSEEVARERKYKVRRLSLHSIVYGGWPGIALDTISSSMSKVRSVSLFGNYGWKHCLLLLSKHLRVLDLQLGMFASRDYSIISEREIFYVNPQLDLTVIVSQLFQLRYLKFYGPRGMTKIPSKIRRLRNLETLEIVADYPTYWMEPHDMPTEIADLPRLSRLVGPWGQMMPDGLGKMKSLRTLAGFDLLRLDIKALGELTNLRDLRLCCAWRHLPEQERQKLCFRYIGVDVLASKGIDSLYSSIGKLRSLRYLEIRPRGLVLIDNDDCLGSLSDPPPSIEILKLRGFLFSRIPQWITAGALNNLRRLELLVSKMSTDEVSVLAELPSLVHLGLELELERVVPAAATANAGANANAIVFSAGFPALESLGFYFYDAGATMYMSCLHFQAGVMPELRNLVLRFEYVELGGGSTATPVGMEQLLNLQHIHVECHRDDYPPASANDAAERAFRNTVEAHPNHPSFTWEWNRALPERKHDDEKNLIEIVPGGTPVARMYQCYRNDL